MNPLHVYSRTYSSSYAPIKRDIANRLIDLRPNWSTFGLTKSKLLVDLSLHNLILKLSLRLPWLALSLKEMWGMRNRRTCTVTFLPVRRSPAPFWECWDRPNNCCTWTIPLKYSYMSRDATIILLKFVSINVVKSRVKSWTVSIDLLSLC